jgi:ATP-dependent HslUV protease subunit HslV
MFRTVRRFFSSSANLEWHHTTILALKRNGETVIIGDGQVSHGTTRIKSDAKKVRKLSDTVYCGFAGAVADALTLM